MAEPVINEIQEFAAQWDRAMVQNDARTIGRFMAGDWLIVGPDGSVTGKDQFLAQIDSGALTHDIMETHDMTVRVHGDMAVTVALGISGGRFAGVGFMLRERVTCVFVRQDGQWQCVHTHLSCLPEAAA